MRPKIERWLFLLLMFQSGLAQSKPPSLGTLTINLTNFRNNKGHAGLTLFKGEEGFPKSPEKAVRALYVPIANNKAVVVFDNLPEGEYAISVYHDENDNKKMDTNFFGIPKEGVGASNNARGHLGPPKYSDARFVFRVNQQTISIQIIYL
ncbi:MAG TPA: DUF2141 domain-containing protein [Chitinophagaceae bacterium]